VEASAVQRRESGWCTEIPGGTSAACAARELLSTRFGEVTPASTMHDLQLLTTELITNAVLHACVDESDTLELRVAATMAGLRVSITDPGASTLPTVQPLDPSVPGGMGLYLVEQLSSKWGVERTRRGETRVWFELTA
jgi:anti-sigma regulatory factor (Ser/Thr protein kinase)